MKEPVSPSLYFDFINYKGKRHSLLFQNPCKIVAASNIEDVQPAFQEIQNAVDEGYYAAGYLSYEAAPAFDQAFHVHKNQKMPLLWFGIFDTPVEESLESNTGEFHTSEWIPKTSVGEYNKYISKIKDYIEQGDTYQVNYTIRMESEFEGDPISFYNQLVQAQSANYSAYLDTGDFTILSASPELFFHMKDGKVTTKPMKGTVGRGKTPNEDSLNADWLYRSVKNRAENVMIVDLLRNDLGMIANPGTVHVPNLFSIEKYPTVYQMTSTVIAEVAPDKSLYDIFKALFPCGSITGAPKISTMKIIKELETSPREVYCGAIGFITPDKEATFNVPIRTVFIDHQNGVAQYGVGGGITWDSTNEEEYKELLIKAKVLHEKRQDFQLIETFGLYNGTYLVFDNHVERLKKSADYFQFDLDIELIKEKLLDVAKNRNKGSWKVRLLVDKNGSSIIEESESFPFQKPIHVALAKEPIEKRDIFLYHKTTNRTIFENSKKQFPDAFDVLLWNEDQEITEFTMGNVVVELAGKLYTPPVDSGLLPGTYRKALIDQGTITERKIMLEELKSCKKVWFINSVREWVATRFIG
ncbi:aminodeoxychorismate synthase component I [Virgibacillus byunsanensis]|uniref:Aminodeoxychorismate synthase component I n=1 Tax=Virgibacillus byunsanensis TaxID=570945 RepID=A0ABW3LPS7_9BACI